VGRYVEVYLSVSCLIGLRLAAYYNAGSSAVVLLLISLAIGSFVWCRVRRRRLRLPVNQTEEESIPLNTSHRYDDDEEGQLINKQRKGKARAVEPPHPPIFDVGDSDDEDDKPPKRNTQDV
jgi:carboxypeptidase D